MIFLVIINNLIKIYFFFYVIFWKIGYLDTKRITESRWPQQYSWFIITDLWRFCHLGSESEWCLLLCRTLTRFGFWCWEVTACPLCLGELTLNASPNTLIGDLDYVELCRFSSPRQAAHENRLTPIKMCCTPVQQMTNFNVKKKNPPQ